MALARRLLGTACTVLVRDRRERDDKRKEEEGNVIEDNRTQFSLVSLFPCIDFDDQKLVCGERNGWVNIWDFDSSSPPPSSYLGDSPAYCNIM